MIKRFTDLNTGLAMTKKFTDLNTDLPIRKRFTDSNTDLSMTKWFTDSITDSAITKRLTDSRTVFLNKRESFPWTKDSRIQKKTKYLDNLYNENSVNLIGFMSTLTTSTQNGGVAKA